MQSSAPYKSKCVLEFNVAVKRFEIKGSLKNYEKDVVLLSERRTVSSVTGVCK